MRKATEMPSIPQRSRNYAVYLLNKGDYPRRGSFGSKTEFMISQAGAFSPSADNLQPWQWMLENKDLLIHPDLTRWHPATDPTQRQMLISMGCFTESLKIVSKNFGWHFESEFESSPDGLPYQRVTLNPGHTPTAEDRRLYGALQRRSNYDLDHTSQPLPPELVAQLRKTFQHPQLAFELVEDSHLKELIAAATVDGNRSIMLKPEFREQLAQYLRDLSTKRIDGFFIPVPDVARPYPVRMIANADEAFTNQFASQDENNFRNSAAIGLIATHESEPHPTLLWRIGELYQRAGIQATSFGVDFGAKGVFSETASHQPIAEIAGLDGRIQHGFRAGFSMETKKQRTPRKPAKDSYMALKDGERQAPSTDKPTIFKLTDSYTLNDLIADLGPDINVAEQAYFHWLMSLFEIDHQYLPKNTPEYSEKLTAYIAEHNHERDGVWVFNPVERSLKPYPQEDDFYRITTENNYPKISREAQHKLRHAKTGVCGLSGSGREVVWALVMSGVGEIRLADFDITSGRNLNRMEGEIGENKTWDLKWQLWKHNPFLKITDFPQGVTEHNVNQIVDGLDIVFDQTDSTSKFTIRKAAKAHGCIVMMQTDMPSPIMDIEGPNDEDFHGQSTQAGITLESMKKITSAAQASVFLPALMGSNDVPAESYINFANIVAGTQDAYAQIYLGAQAGGSAAGQAVLAWASGKLPELIKETKGHYVVHMRPILHGEEEAQQETMQTFLETALRKHGTPDLEKYYQQFIQKK